MPKQKDGVLRVRVQPNSTNFFATQVHHKIGRRKVFRQLTQSTRGSGETVWDVGIIICTNPKKVLNYCG